jgi:hypothetical protein
MVVGDAVGVRVGVRVGIAVKVKVGEGTAVRADVGEPAGSGNKEANASMVRALSRLLVAVAVGSWVESLRSGS